MTSTKRLGRLVALFLTLIAQRVAGEDWPDWPRAKELHPGLRLAQTQNREPRPLSIHAVKIDLGTPGLRFASTPRAAGWEPNKTETLRQTTRDFLRTSQRTTRPIVLATNADAFSPWPAPWNQPTPTDLAGLAVNDGVVVSPPSGSPSLLITKSGTASLAATNAQTKLDEIQVAVSGFAFCLREGVPQPSGDDRHPRTGIGLSADGRQLFVMAIDGRRHSSPGATTHELGEWMRRCGAHSAINMDGGGSTTLAWWNPKAPGPDKAELLNSPVGNGLSYPSALAESAYVPTERANGSHLGVYFLPKDAAP